MQLDLSGRTAIVTGAGRGIGEVIALTFAEAGATVVAAARTESQIVETVDTIRDRGGDGLAVPTDLGDLEDIERLVERSTAHFGPPDILVNNAALNLVGDPLEYDPESVDAMTRVNYRGTLFLTQAFARRFRESDRADGRVVNISSVAAVHGIRGMAAYGGTKAGVNGLTKNLAAELAPLGITVNGVSPGLTEVDRITELIEEKGDELYDLDRIPLDRLCAPEDIANACLYFASSMGSYVTGQILTVDGGVSFTAGLYRNPVE